MSNWQAMCDEWRAQAAAVLKKSGCGDLSRDASAILDRPEQPLVRIIDHTLLRQDAGSADFELLATQAVAMDFAACCVPSNRVAAVKGLLAGSGCLLATVVGFPMGYASTAAKVAEASAALHDGADELDMVICVADAKEGRLAAVYAEVRAVVEAAGPALVKVILETAALTDEQIVGAGLAALWAGAGMLKTSTGFGPGGATIDHVRLLRAIAGTRAGVKASGGIRTREVALAMRYAGADRIGSSSAHEFCARGGNGT